MGRKKKVSRSPGIPVSEGRRGGGGSEFVGDDGRRGGGCEGGCGIPACGGDVSAAGRCGVSVTLAAAGLPGSCVPSTGMGLAPGVPDGSPESGLSPGLAPKGDGCAVTIQPAEDEDDDGLLDEGDCLARGVAGSCMNLESRAMRVGLDVQLMPSVSLNGDGPPASGCEGALGLGHVVCGDLASSKVAGGLNMGSSGEFFGRCGVHKEGAHGLVKPSTVTFAEALRDGSIGSGRGGGSGCLSGGPTGGPSGHGPSRFSMGERSDRGHVLVPESVVEVGARSFETTLVGLILGHCPPFAVVERFAMRLWASYGIRRVRAFGPGQLLLEFDSADRFPTLLERSPWTIAGRPVLLRHWTPEMSFEDLQPHTLPVWVKFSGMPTSLYTEVGLDLIASSFGKPILMDQVTRSGTRLRFARILVELDASTQIEREVTFELPGGATFTVSAEYAFMPPQCCECRVFGHGSSRCPRRVRAEPGPQATDSQGMAGVSLAVDQRPGVSELQRPRRRRRSRGAPAGGQGQTGSQTQTQTLSQRQHPGSVAPSASGPLLRMVSPVSSSPSLVETPNPFEVFSALGDADVASAAGVEESRGGPAVGGVVVSGPLTSPAQSSGRTIAVDCDRTLVQDGVSPLGEEGPASPVETSQVEGLTLGGDPSARMGPGPLFCPTSRVPSSIPSVSSPEGSDEHSPDSHACDITRFVIVEPSPLMIRSEERQTSLTPLPLAILPPTRLYGECLDRDP
ncbi:hypothetical protein Dimus_038635 [Dionaea muscipula]